MLEAVKVVAPKLPVRPAATVAFGSVSRTGATGGCAAAQSTHESEIKIHIASTWRTSWGTSGLPEPRDHP